jgi:hypothetical protein
MPTEELFGAYDVVVVGGGASGCAAAIAAARAGANTILIDKMGILGGMINVSGPPGWAFSHLWNNQGETIIAGIVEEIHHRMEKEGLALPYPKPADRHFNAFAFIDPDWCGLLLFQMMTENKVNLLLHSLAVDVLKEGNTVKGVIVENTSGRQIVLGKVIIECTGEGDIAVRAGVPFTKIDRTKEEIDPPSITFHMDGVDWGKVTAYVNANAEEFAQGIRGRTPTTEEEERRKKQVAQYRNCKSLLDLVRAGTLGSITFRKLSREAVANGDLPPLGVDLGFFFTFREGGTIQPVYQHSAQIPDCDHTDVRELTAGEVEARRQVAIAIRAARKYMPGHENAYFSRLTSYMRIREGRHMIGDYQVTFDDVANARKFGDVVTKSAMSARVGGPFHSARYPADSMNINPGKTANPKDGGSYDIPYRALVPKNVEGMLMAGKLMSTTEDFKRDLLPDNMANGQACGVAAAICARKGITPRELEKDVSELQTILVKQGAVLTGTK